MHVVVHAVDHLEGASGIRALQQATLLDADKQGIGVMGVKRDVLGMGNVGRGREAPVGHIYCAQGRQLCPVTSEIIAIEQVRWLCASIQARAAGQPHACQAIHIGLSEPVVAPFPGARPPSPLA